MGALLQITDHGTGRSFLPAYDGNGNIAALLNAATGDLAAAFRELADEFRTLPEGQIDQRFHVCGQISGYGRVVELQRERWSFFTQQRRQRHERHLPVAFGFVGQQAGFVRPNPGKPHIEFGLQPAGGKRFRALQQGLACTRRFGRHTHHGACFQCRKIDGVQFQ